MLYLGCDGGATKFSYVVATERGRVLARCRFPGLNIIEMGAEAFYRAMREQITATLAAADVLAADITGAMFAVTGYGEGRTSVQDLQAAVSRTLGHDRFTLANDAVAGWSGALLGAPGIVVASGTGCVAYGEDGVGGAARAGGWSILYGDEGSSYWVSVQALNAFFRQADGRLPRTRLYDWFLERFAVEDPLHLPEVFHAEFGQDVSKIAGFQREVLALYNEGDACVSAIYRRAGDELAAMAEGLMRRLAFSQERPVTVSYTGGLFRAGEAIVRPFEKAVQRLGAALVPPRYGPAVGAVCYAARPSLDRAALDAMYAAVDASLRKEGYDE